MQLGGLATRALLGSIPLGIPLAPVPANGISAGLRGLGGLRLSSRQRPIASFPSVSSALSPAAPAVAVLLPTANAALLTVRGATREDTASTPILAARKRLFLATAGKTSYGNHPIYHRHHQKLTRHLRQIGNESGPDDEPTSCPPDQRLCGSGDCIGLDGDCCVFGGFCDAGWYCHDEGCCLNGYTCNDEDDDSATVMTTTHARALGVSTTSSSPSSPATSTTDSSALTTDSPELGPASKVTETVLVTATTAPASTSTNYAVKANAVPMGVAFVMAVVAVPRFL
ncbi:hypothetical protein B0T17DRAFT_615040 [Bombardia bombarda]|uniref:Uncharacterized protein n=1 Tax=Bombardia bombarda TaxID=252184 RepID=A0AA39X8G0_9PEZI|nr:hypothetical protein B0T17DRAFT_615040 [Bombardia bombarda]